MAATTYRVGTITGPQAGLSATCLVQSVEWISSGTERNQQTESGEVYLSSVYNIRSEVKITAVVPNQYSGLPAAGASIAVSGATYRISSSRKVSSNRSATTLEITGYLYPGASGSHAFAWILTDEQSGYEYTTLYGVVWDDATGSPAYSVRRMGRSTNARTWRTAISADAASPGMVNPGNLSPVGSKAGQWSCIDAGTSRSYFLNGQLLKEAFVTWQMVSAWEEIDDDSSSSA